MKFLTFDLIKQQLRLDDGQAQMEEALLMMYGEAAEETVMNHLRRDYQNIMETYGIVPAPIIQAALMLVDVSYQHRSPVSPQNMSIVPYTFDILVKPYMRLANNVNENNYNYGCPRL